MNGAGPGARWRAARRWAWSGPVWVAAAIMTAACGGGAVNPAGTPSPAGTPGPGSARPGPIPAATLKALTTMSSQTIQPVTSAEARRAGANLARSRATVMRSVLAQLPHGSQILGLTLAYVWEPSFGRQSKLLWVVSADPYGLAYREDIRACGREDYDIFLESLGGGTPLVGMVGTWPGLRPLPVLGPAPALVPGQRCVGDLAPVPWTRPGSSARASSAPAPSAPAPSAPAPSAPAPSAAAP
jgi:hypothetical protein